MKNFRRKIFLATGMFLLPQEMLLKNLDKKKMLLLVMKKSL